MAETIRIRCQVLKAYATHGPCTAKALEKYLPHLKPAQIQKTSLNLYHEDDELKVIGTVPRPSGTGTQLNVYQCRDAAEPRHKKHYKKTGSKKSKLHIGAKLDLARGRMMIRFRDKKIALLERLAPTLTGTDKDLMIGIINDLRQG